MTESNDKFIAAIQICRSDAPMMSNLAIGLKTFSMLDLAERARFQAVYAQLQSLMLQYRTYIQKQPLSKIVHWHPLVMASGQIRQYHYQGIKQGITTFETVLASRPSCGSNLATVNVDLIPLIARHLFKADLFHFCNTSVHIRRTIKPLLPLVTLDVETTHVVGKLATVTICLKRRQMGTLSHKMWAEIVAMDEKNQPLKGAIQQFSSPISIWPKSLQTEVKIRFLKAQRELRLACRVTVVLPEDVTLYYFGQSELIRVRATQARKRAREPVKAVESVQADEAVSPVEAGVERVR